MTINAEEAYGLEPFGVAFKDDDGNVLYYLTGGSGSPVGTDSPIATLYIDQDSGSVWRKFALGATNWSKLIEDRFIDRIYLDDILVPENKFVVLHDACFTTGNLILEGEAIVL